MKKNMNNSLNCETERCCVPECNAVFSKNRNFFNFPHDDKLKRVWITLCSITKPVTNDSLICNAHFVDQDFITGPNVKVRLKEFAIPSKNLPDVYEEFTPTENTKKAKVVPNLLKKKSIPCVIDDLKEFDPKEIQKEKNKLSKKDLNPEQDKSFTTHRILADNVIEIVTFKCGSQKPKNVKRACCVPHCTVQRNEKRSYHSLPKDADLRDKWLRACKIRRNININAKVCSAHFNEEDYLNGATSKRRVLKSTSVPSLTVKKSNTKLINGVQYNTNKRSDKSNENVTTIIYMPEDSTNIENKSKITSILDLPKIIASINKSIVSTNPTSEDKNVTSVKRKCTESDQNVDNAVTKKSKHIQIENAEDVHITLPRDVSAMTFCTKCRRFCKIEDKDLIDIDHRNIETLAAEILLELQKVNPSDEVERVLLYRKGIEICDRVLKMQNIYLMNLLANDEELIVFTGINYELLNMLTKLVIFVEGNTTKFSNSARDRIVMCLCKIRINLSYRSLSLLFGITQRDCIIQFASMTQVLSSILSKVICWPKTENLDSLPKPLQLIKQTKVILNCFEFKIEKQVCSKCVYQLNSDVKKEEIIKLLLGITPSGIIIYKSKVFEDRQGKNLIFAETDILNHLNPSREAIMADDSLNIEKECVKHDVTLLKIPKIENNKHINRNDLEFIKNIFAARIHFDRTLQRFKRYKILQTNISWKIVPHIDNICTIIAGIINLRNPIPLEESLLKMSGLFSQSQINK